MTSLDMSQNRMRRRLFLGGGTAVALIATLESPEFMRQSREFAAAVQADGKSVQLLVGENYNHFEMIETLGNPYGLLGHAVLEQMHIGVKLRVPPGAK